LVIMIWKYKSRIAVKLRVSDIMTTGVNIRFVILLPPSPLHGHFAALLAAEQDCTISLGETWCD